MIFHCHRFHDEDFAKAFADLARERGHDWVHTKRLDNGVIVVSLFY